MTITIPQSEVLKLLVLFEQQSKFQRYLITFT